MVSGDCRPLDLPALDLEEEPGVGNLAALAWGHVPSPLTVPCRQCRRNATSGEVMPTPDARGRMASPLIVTLRPGGVAKSYSPSEGIGQ